MEQPCNRNYLPTSACAPEGISTSSSDSDYPLRKQVDNLCITLFDRWCERREITPLIYLLHAWPLVPSKPPSIKKLAAALRDLSMFHTETLDDMDRELIDHIHAITGYDR
jgi:hypothetical protein